MKLEHLTNYLKGFLMGTADLVPGVSGGTIALLTGIYPRLIRALSAPTQGPFWAALRGLRIRDAAKEVDLALLVAVGLGAISAVFGLARVVSYLLDNEPHLLLGFFFGLVFASAIYVCTLVREYKPLLLLLAFLGLVLTFLLGTLDPTPNHDGTAPSTTKYFFCGLAAIAAMLMPGISGSLLLVNLGMYAQIVNDVKNLNPSLLIFCLGAGIGLLVFSRLIRGLLARYNDELMAVICGILLSSLYLIWPWKKAIDGIPFAGQPNLLPRQYTDPDTIWVSLLILTGVCLVGLIQFLAVRRGRALDMEPQAR